MIGNIILLKFFHFNFLINGFRLFANWWLEPVALIKSVFYFIWTFRWYLWSDQFIIEASIFWSWDFTKILLAFYICFLIMISILILVNLKKIYLLMELNEFLFIFKIKFIIYYYLDVMLRCLTINSWILFI